MTICRGCEKNFHSCSSCSLLNEWEYEFCSHSCFDAWLNKQTPYWTATLHSLTKDDLKTTIHLLEEKEYGEEILVRAMNILLERKNQKEN